MPLIVKDYKWRQSNNFVIIQVPLHGVPTTKVDLLTSPNYIKASFEKYFFEVFLLYSVDVRESKCTTTPDEIIFELSKCELLRWDQLEINLSKKEKQELKQKYIEEEQLKFQEECKKKSDKKHELKKVAVREQINIDTKQRNKIDSIKNEEKTKALGDLKEWNSKSTPKIVEIHSDEEDDESKEEIKPIKSIRIPPPFTPICSVKRQNKLKLSTLIPLPRKCATLHVDFTPRQFPTPSRESQLAEEEEWLRKQAEVRRTVGFVSEDLRPEEKNPQYMNSKGQEFLKSENYLGAISAFSFGIKLCKEYPDLYVGRSEAHYKKENFFKCAQDCSTALDLLRPAVPSNLDQRVTCIRRRGMALRKMGYLRESVNELEMAVKLKTFDEEIKNSLKEAKEEYEKQQEEQK
ncbi:hypothetical protein FQA39_LY03956 [Lamprigera yunnana]|nr:hypothetical protein FQA39_LY03956 [Lamprigera yunnana]